MANLFLKFRMCNYIIYSWIHFNLEYVNTRFLNLTDYHLAISDGICRQLLELNLGNKSNIYKIYNPVKLSSNVITRKKNNEFIYVGRITYEGQKDIKELIDNLAHLNFNNWTLRVIGEGVDKDKCQRYLDQKYPKLKNKVFWEGWKTNTWASIQQADALILTSSYEGLPMVLLEAISRGLPCLSSSIDGPNSIIQPSINGELYKKGDKDDFSFKLSKLLKTNYDPVVMKQSISPFYINNYINLNFKNKLATGLK
ncbi:glycosyltransferase [Limosilactobacillus vaginalis]|nr:glycosyltransferase [Limosilactobacillus vaginalis]QFS34259.1 glycosyltransferase [Limosilactobacillus vaginalis]